MNDGDPKSTYWAVVVDIIREVCRNFLGLGVVAAVLYMMYQFVLVTPAEERMQVMLLVIGWIGGFASGIGTWYFGGAMRSAMKGADIARREAEAKFERREQDT